VKNKKEEVKKEEVAQEPKLDMNFDEKYKNLLVSLTKDWDKISRANSSAIAKNVSEELTNGQKEYIDLLARKSSDFNIVQLRYFGEQLKERIDELRPLPMLSINKNWKSLTEKCNSLIKFRQVSYSK